MTRPTRVLAVASVAIAALGVSVPAGLFLMERAERAARARIEPWRESPNWVGTCVSNVPIPIPALVRKAFEEDPPAPENRRSMFAMHFGKTAYPCVGWQMNIEDVRPETDGWSVDLTAHVRLSPGRAFDFGKTTETWHVSRSGRARNVNCESDGVHILSVD
jgi:hypothetical protein